VIAVMSESSSSRFSFNFFTNDSMARFANPSDSPPCWIIMEATTTHKNDANINKFSSLTYSMTHQAVHDA
jgi:hypothetical protein